MRGISPVVATILMVVIAITAAVVAYSWFTSVQGTLQAKASQRLSTVSSVTFTVPAVKCEGQDVNVLIMNLSDEKIEANASAVLLNADGTVYDMNNNVGTITVDPHQSTTLPIKFNKECENAKAIMVTIGSASVTVALR